MKQRLQISDLLRRIQTALPGAEQAQNQVVKLKLVVNLRDQLHIRGIGPGQPQQPERLSHCRPLIFWIGPVRLQKVP